jgi:protein-tyrosine phosphatase
MAGEGVTKVVCTPHLRASQAAEAPTEDHLRLLNELRARTGPSPELLPGWEIMLDLSAVDLSPPMLSLGGSQARLVEFPRRGLPPDATEQLLRLRMSGVVPVVAHAERYRGCTVDVLLAWRELGAVIQCDTFALLGTGSTTDLARTMLERGLVDVLASDNHGDRRSLSMANQWMEELGAKAQVHLLTFENPRRLLADRPLLPVAPVRFEKGVLARLKSLFFGRREYA